MRESSLFYHQPFENENPDYSETGKMSLWSSPGKEKIFIVKNRSLHALDCMTKNDHIFTVTNHTL